MIRYIFLCLGLMISASIYAEGFFAGLMSGYGSTTWEGLVPPPINQNSALNLSTPTHVHEGGLTLGIWTGYEFSSMFGAEFNYMHYPNAKVAFDSESLFSFEHNNALSFVTQTEAVTLLAKIMLPIVHTPARIFSGFGAANVHRKDILVNNWRLTPSFSVGVSSPLNEHVLAEISGNYTAGYGESQLNPADTYFPFLYSMTLRLGWRL